MTGIDSCFLIDLYWKDSPRHAGALALYESFASGNEQILIYHNVFKRNRLNDTAMAACYIQNGASRIITANGSDFAQFAGLEVVEY